MKKIIYILFAATLFCLTGCEDYLNTSSSSKLSSDNVYTSLYYTESAVMGIYDRVCDAQAYAQRFSTNWCTNSDTEHVGADENTYNALTYRGLSNYFATPDNTTLEWTRIYSLIERANLVVAGIRESQLYLNGTRDEMAAMGALLGEALTLRALAYFELTRHWGDVPFKMEATDKDLGNVYIKKTDRDEIQDQLIEDLIEAQELLPWIGESAGSISYNNAERVTKSFAKGLIGRICLARAGYSLRDKEGYPMERASDPQKYYKIAQEHLKDVIDSNKHTLKGTYLQIWRDVCAINKQDGVGGENLYEVALGLEHSGEIGYSIGVRFYANSKYGYSNNTNVVNMSAYYFYSFDKQDSRRDATVSMINYSNNNGDLKEFFQSNTLSFTLAKWDQRWMAENSKWLTKNLGVNGKWGYGVNWIVMRYADVLLMYAEVENELNNGPTQAAKDAFREVRGRAFIDSNSYTEKVTDYVQNLNSYDDFFTAIVNERAWEFGGEAVRKYDLIRWNLLTTKILEQRNGFISMLKGEPVQIYDKYYEDIPANIYYKYQSDNENIDRSVINFYETNATLDDYSSDELTAGGWTRVKWLSGMNEDDIEKYTLRVSVFSSGLFKETNGVCDNRYLFPIQGTVINDYQGVISNSYGY